jgi:uncharacterized protein (DUF433 family)
MLHIYVTQPASGMTENEFLADYPYLESADFKAVYA